MFTFSPNMYHCTHKQEDITLDLLLSIPHLFLGFSGLNLQFIFIIYYHTYISHYSTDHSESFLIESDRMRLYLRDRSFSGNDVLNELEIVSSSTVVGTNSL